MCWPLMSARLPQRGLFILPASGLRSGEPQSCSTFPERESRNQSLSFCDLASISDCLRQTLTDMLLPASLSRRQTISSGSLAAIAFADISTVRASGSWITPPSGAEGISDSTAAAPADGSVTAGAGASGPEDAHAPMHNEIAASKIRLFIVSPILCSNPHCGLYVMQKPADADRHVRL